MNLDDKARMARIGLDILDFVVMLTVILLLLFGGYSLFDNWNTAQQGFSPALMQYKPDDEGSLSFNKLMSVNPDVIGWITIDQTHIDQPMVQGSNDFEYLNRNAKKEFSLSAKTGFGADGTQFDMERDFEMVRGAFESNSFVAAVQRHIEVKTDLARRMLEALDAIPSA